MVVKNKLQKFSLAIYFSLAYALISVLFYGFYQEVVFERYAYMGFTELENSYAFLVFILGGINGLAYYYLVGDGMSLKNLFTCLYFNIVLIPSTIFIFTTGFSIEAIAFYLILYIYPIIQKIPYRKTVKSLPILNNVFIYLLCSFLVFLVFSNVTPSFSNFNVTDFADLYDIRMTSRDQLSEGPLIVAYSYMLIFKVIAPLILSYGLLIGKRLLVFVAIMVFFLGFMVSAHKSILLTPIAMLGLYYCIQKSKSIKLILCNSVFVLSLISFFSSGVVQFIFGEVLMRRVFLVPGMLTNIYFDYFSVHDFNLFNSITSKFSDERVTPLPFIIGENVFGRSEMSANANFVASGYAEAGVIGLIFYVIVILLTFLILDSRVKLEKNIYLLTSFPVLLAMLETNLTTIFLTHGLVFIILIKFLWKIKHV